MASFDSIRDGRGPGAWRLMRLLEPLLAATARGALRERFSADEIARILDDAFADYSGQRARLPMERQAGGRLMVHFAALTAGVYRALRARDVSERDARRLTAEMTWRVYEKLAAVPWAIARATRASAFGRLERATRLFRAFPFGAPSYDMADVPAEAGVVAFDVRRCPVAEYFRAEGLSELCAEAWCNLDVPLATKWGARLERSTTLAQGADRCDFRWRVEPDRKGAG